jgi:hypothetical protein
MKALRYAVMAGLAATLAACAAPPAPPERLAPPRIEAATRHPGSLEVVAMGGCAPCSISQAALSDDSLAAAVVAALRESGVFAGAGREPGASYKLVVQVFRVDMPMIGMSMRSEAELGWTLTDTRTGRELWRRAFRTSHVATFGDSPIGQLRAELAWQGAVAANIAEAVTALGRLPLPPAGR